MVRIDPEGNDNERWPIQTRKLVDFAINNIVQESLTAYGAGCLFMRNGLHVFVISQKDEASPIMLGEAVKDNIARYLKLTVSVGLGGPVEALQELYNRIGDQSVSREQTLMDRIAAYIRDNFQSDISLESAAAVAFMNPYYFSSFFKKHMKRNFKQYVTDLRMEQAVSLLTHTDLMVYEIADKVGYRNARHFSDMFKKQTGMLPQEFKQSIRQ